MLTLTLTINWGNTSVKYVADATTQTTNLT